MCINIKAYFLIKKCNITHHNGITVNNSLSCPCRQNDDKQCFFLGVLLADVLFHTRRRSFILNYLSLAKVLLRHQPSSQQRHTQT